MNNFFSLFQEFDKLVAKKLILKIVMETSNLSADGQKRTVETLLCSTSLTAGLHSHLKFLSILNSFLSRTAILGNILILIAFH